MHNKLTEFVPCSKLPRRVIYRISAILFFLSLLPLLSFSATITSTATGGSWTLGGTWVGGVAPVATDDVIIATTGGAIVTLNATSVCTGVVINTGAILTTAAIGLTVNGSWQNNGTFNNGIGSVTFGGTSAINGGTGTANFRNIIVATGADLTINTSVTLAGTFTYANPAASTNALVTISGSNTVSVAGAMTITRALTNTFYSSFVVGNGTLTVGGTFSMTGTTGTRYAILDISGGTVNLENATASGVASQINISGSGTVNISGNVTGTGSPSLSTTTGTFNYDGTSGQTIWASAYYNINVSGNNTKTLNSGTTTINNLLTIVDAGTTLNVNTATLVFPVSGTSLVNNGTLNGGTGNGTINYTAVSGTQDVYDINYNNIGFSGAGTKTIVDGSTLNVARNLTTSVPLAFTGTANANIGGLLSGVGAITIGSGTITLGGSWTNTGVTVPGTSTVVLNSASAQSGRGNFYKLTLSGGGAKSITTTTIINNLLTIESGTTLTLTTIELRFAAANAFTIGAGVLDPGASTAIISFYGTDDETIPDLPYRNLTFAGAGTKTIAAGTTLNVALTWAMGVAPTVMDGDANAVVLVSTSGTGSFTMGTGTLSIGVSFASGAFTPGTGTVHYTRNDGTVQSVRNTTYYNLKVSGTSVKTIASTSTVSNKLTIDGSPYNFSTRSVTYSGAGDPIEIINGGTFYGTTGVSIFNSALAQNVPALDYGPLTISGTGGTVITGNTNVSGTFTTGASASIVLNDAKLLTITGSWSNSGALDMTGSASVTLTGTISGTGTITMNTGNLTIGTSWTAGTLVPGTGKVLYNGTVSQAVRGLNYYDLEFSDVGTKTIATATTATIARNWIVNSPVTLTSSASADVTGDISGAGAITMNTGTIALEGNWANSGDFISGSSGTVLYDGAGAQSVRGMDYTNLQFAEAGIKTLAGDATVSRVMTFNTPSIFNLSSRTFNLSASGTPIAGTGTLQPATSTVLYSGTALTTIAALDYYNLDLSGGDRVLPNGETVGIARSFIPGAGVYTVTGSTVHFNGSAEQTIPAFNYENLTGTGGNRILISGGSIGIAGTFTPGAGTYTVTGNTVNFNGSVDQTIPAFTFNQVVLSGTGRKIITAIVTVQEIDINDGPTLDLDSSGGGVLNVDL